MGAELEFLGIPSPVGYKLGISENFWEFLGISRFLELDLLWLGIPRNFQSEFTLKIHTFIPQNF